MMYLLKVNNNTIIPTNVPSTHFIMDDRNNQLIILGHVCKFALKCKNLYRIGPRSDVGGQTVAKSGEVFYGRSVCRSVGRRGVGWRRAESDGGRWTDGSFYFSLEPPNQMPCPIYMMGLSLSLKVDFFFILQI